MKIRTIPKQLKARKLKDLKCLKDAVKPDANAIVLPWLNPDLNPNKRLYWAKKIEARKVAKKTAYNEALKLAPPKAKTYHLKIVFHPPAYHNYDLDNCLATIKAELDGIADAWGVNDKQFRPITIDFGDKVEGGMIVLTVLG